MINIVPFLLILNLAVARRKNKSSQLTELELVAEEIRIVGVLGYTIILSIYFFSIPSLSYSKAHGNRDILLVEPDEYTVFLIALISFSLVVAGIYLKLKKRWAYYLCLFVDFILIVYSFLLVLDLGIISMIPIIVFTYLLYKLTRPTFRSQLFQSHQDKM